MVAVDTQQEGDRAKLGLHGAPLVRAPIREKRQSIVSEILKLFVAKFFSFFFYFHYLVRLHRNLIGDVRLKNSLIIPSLL